MSQNKKNTTVEILPVSKFSSKNFCPGTIIGITMHLPYHNHLNLCIKDFVKKGKKNNFVCAIIGTIANHQEYGGYTATLYIHKSGVLKLEIQT